MTTLVSKAIANCSDQSLCEASALALKGGEDSSMRGILAGAVFLKVRGDNKETSALLFLALKATHITETTATAHVSRCRAAAMGKHFTWAIDVNATLDANVDGVLPEFAAYWGAVRDIKRAGPPSDEAKAAAKAKREAAKSEAKVVEERVVVNASPSDIIGAFLELIQAAGAPESGKRYAVDALDLVRVSQAIDAELLARQAEGSLPASEQVEQIAA